MIACSSVSRGSAVLGRSVLVLSAAAAWPRRRRRYRRLPLPRCQFASHAGSVAHAQAPASCRPRSGSPVVAARPAPRPDHPTSGSPRDPSRRVPLGASLGRDVSAATYPVRRIRHPGTDYPAAPARMAASRRHRGTGQLAAADRDRHSGHLAAGFPMDPGMTLASTSGNESASNESGSVGVPAYDAMSAVRTAVEPESVRQRELLLSRAWHHSWDPVHPAPGQTSANQAPSDRNQGTL